MRQIDHLKLLTTRAQFAAFLGVPVRTMTHILYVLTPANRYTSFDIPKRDGGVRKINAPVPVLKDLQTKLTKILVDCVKEIQAEELEQHKKVRYLACAYGFLPDKSIVHNARNHRDRRHVLNLDIQDFFGSINFGRVRGVFISDRRWNLDPVIATLIAQIACHGQGLPQGAPTSPVVSNVVGQLLDSRMRKLAKRDRCSYSRYADDLTFSTNIRKFPAALAVTDPVSLEVSLGDELSRELNRAGFTANPGKTRLQGRTSRQVVTGLVVNEKVDIDRRYYRRLRSMLRSVAKTGSYYLPGRPLDPKQDLKFLEGMFAHAYHVQCMDIQRDEPERMRHAQKFGMDGQSHQREKPPVFDLFASFLKYKHFVARDTPLMLVEGVTDPIYIKCALTKLSLGDLAAYPRLVALSPVDPPTPKIRFLTASDTVKDVLDLGTGVGGQVKLLQSYHTFLEGFDVSDTGHPVIILCDNDEAAKKVFTAAKDAAKKLAKQRNQPDPILIIELQSKDKFYYVGGNLYLVKLPEDPAHAPVVIEDLLSQALRNQTVAGKWFNGNKAAGTKLDKVPFAKEVVRASTDPNDFKDFKTLFDRLDSCVAHFEGLQAAAAQIALAAAAATAATVSSP